MTLTQQQIKRASRIAKKGLKPLSGQKLMALRNVFWNRDNFRPLKTRAQAKALTKKVMEKR